MAFSNKDSLKGMPPVDNYLVYGKRKDYNRFDTGSRKINPRPDSNKPSNRNSRRHGSKNVSSRGGSSGTRRRSNSNKPAVVKLYEEDNVY
jgi:hypothetical protein